MKLAVEFPSISYREGGAGVIRLAKGIEDIGYDQLDMFDHVIMGYPTEHRSAPRYPPEMPVLEALMTLSFVASATSRIGLGTEVLVLPQRQPVLVAKQISTLDTLSGGRVRLGIGVGWQESEFEALGEDFSTRGKRMDECIELMRAYFSDSKVEFNGSFYRSNAMAMEPKPPQGEKLPIWIGGSADVVLRRVGKYGDGWLSSAQGGSNDPAKDIETIRRYADEEGRDGNILGMQSMLNPPPTTEDAKHFYSNLDAVATRAEEIQAHGFDWVTINATAIFQSGARSVDAMVNELGKVHDRLRLIVG